MNCKIWQTQQSHFPAIFVIVFYFKWKKIWLLDCLFLPSINASAFNIYLQKWIKVLSDVAFSIRMLLQRRFQSTNIFTNFKVENILKGSLDSIPSPSPSVKIQIMGGKVFLRCKGKTLLGVDNKIWKQKNVDITQQCFALLPHVNFPIQ